MPSQQSVSVQYYDQISLEPPEGSYEEIQKLNKDDFDT